MVARPASNGMHLIAHGLLPHHANQPHARTAESHLGYTDNGKLGLNPDSPSVDLAAEILCRWGSSGASPGGISFHDHATNPRKHRRNSRGPKSDHLLKNLAERESAAIFIQRVAFVRFNLVALFLVPHFAPHLGAALGILAGFGGAVDRVTA
jgi:hypothetical protein